MRPSFCSFILREKGHDLGRTRRFSILAQKPNENFLSLKTRIGLFTRVYWTSRRFHELVLKNANKKRNKIVYYCKLTNIANNIFLALILVRLEAIYVLMLLTFFLFVVRVASGWLLVVVWISRSIVLM